jgi:RHS repeat-associated protein
MGAWGQKQYYLDPETQLFLLGSGTDGRYYDPSTGRFLSEDPIRWDAGDENLYRLTGNDPVNKVDPSGHFWGEALLERAGSALVGGAITATNYVERKVDAVEQLVGEYGPKLKVCASRLNTDVTALVRRIINGDVHSMADLLGVPPPQNLTPPQTLKLIEKTLEHECLKAIPGYETLLNRVGSAENREKLLTVLRLAWKVGMDPKAVLDQMMDSPVLLGIMNKVPDAIESATEQLVSGGGKLEDAIKSVGASAGGAVKSAVTKEVSEDAGILAGVGKAIAANATAFKKLILSGKWKGALLDAAKEQLWPWGPPLNKEKGVLPDIKLAWQEIKSAGSALWQSSGELAGARSPGAFLGVLKKQADIVVDAVVKVWGIANSALGSLQLWITIASALIGSLFFGVGAAAGLGVAEAIGLGVLASTLAQNLVATFKAIADLKTKKDLTQKEKQERYSEIAGGAVMLAVTGVMVLLGPVAAKLGRKFLDLLLEFRPVAVVFEAVGEGLTAVDRALLGLGRKLRGLVKGALRADGHEVEVAVDEATGEALLAFCSEPCNPTSLDGFANDLPEGPDKAKVQALAKEVRDGPTPERANQIADEVEAIKAKPENQTDTAAPTRAAEGRSARDLNKELDDLTKRAGGIKTAGVGATDVRGLEDEVFEMGSRKVRGALNVEATPGPIKAPYPYDDPRYAAFVGHMEEEFGNKFIKALGEAGYRPNPNGIFVEPAGNARVLMNNPLGACGHCTLDLLSPSEKVGVIKQLSELVPNVKFTFDTVAATAKPIIVKGGIIVTP